MCPQCSVNIRAQLDANNSAMEQTKLHSLAGTISDFFLTAVFDVMTESTFRRKLCWLTCLILKLDIFCTPSIQESFFLSVSKTVYNETVCIIVVLDRNFLQTLRRKLYVCRNLLFSFHVIRIEC